MRESLTSDEELVLFFLKKHPKSTASEISMHMGLKHRHVLTRALEGLHAKGFLKFTDDRDERYYVIHTG